MCLIKKLMNNFTYIHNGMSSGCGGHYYLDMGCAWCWGFKPQGVCEVVLPFCSMAVNTLSGAGAAPQLLDPVSFQGLVGPDPVPSCGAE